MPDTVMRKLHFNNSLHTLGLAIGKVADGLQYDQIDDAKDCIEEAEGLLEVVLKSLKIAKGD